MKKILSFALVCFLMIGLATLQAQPTTKKRAAKTNNSKSSENTPQKVAEDVCNCVNSFLNQYHPSIRKMMEDMAEFGEEKATENFQNTLLSLQGKEQEKALADAKRFSDDVRAGKMDNCIKNFEASVANMTDAEKEQVLRELESSPSCKIIDDLIKIGNQK